MVEETRPKRKNRVYKRVMAYQGCTSRGKLYIQDKTRSKKKFSNQVHSYFSKTNIGFLTLCPKRLEMEINQMINKLVPSVVRRIRVIT